MTALYNVFIIVYTSKYFHNDTRMKANEFI